MEEWGARISNTHTCTHAHTHTRRDQPHTATHMHTLSSAHTCMPAVQHEPAPRERDEHTHENSKECGLCTPHGHATAQPHATSATHPHHVQHTLLHMTQCASTRAINRGAQEGPGREGRE
jgi:hypothetical protein